MEYVYIDTALMAVPNYAVDATEADEIFERLYHLAIVATSPMALRLVLDAQIEEVLWANNLAPTIQQVDEFVGLMDLAGVFSPRDLTMLYQTLIQRTVKSTDVAPVDVRSIASFEAAPPLKLESTPIVLHGETRRVFSSVAASLHFDSGWHVAASTPGRHPESVSVNVEVVDAVGTHADLIKPLPTFMSQEVQILRRVSDLVDARIAERIWRNAKDAGDLQLSLVIGALAILASEDGIRPKTSDLAEFSIGREFLQTLTPTQCVGLGKFAGSAHKLCCQLVARRCQRHVGDFGRPEPTIRDSDGAKAKRVHLTGASEGLRLMFWDCAGWIEFANVGVKHELEISKAWDGVTVRPIAEIFEAFDQ